jgi:hypothetical protein
MPDARSHREWVIVPAHLKGTRMVRISISMRLLLASCCLALPAAAGAEECSRGDGALSYCKCLYEDALDRIRDQQGSDSVSIRKRVQAAASALKKCMSGGMDEASDEMNKV